MEKQIIEAFKNEISKSVSDAVSYYISVSIIQGFALSGNEKILLDIKDGFTYGMNALKENYKQVFGLSNLNEMQAKVIEALDIPSLIEMTQKPYETVIDKAIEKAREEDEKKESL